MKKLFMILCCSSALLFAKPAKIKSVSVASVLSMEIYGNKINAMIRGIVLPLGCAGMKKVPVEDGLVTMECTPSPYYAQALARLRELVLNDKMPDVTLTPRPVISPLFDGYSNYLLGGVLMADVILSDGTNVAKALVQEGLAMPLSVDDVPSDYVADCEMAVGQKMGMFSDLQWKPVWYYLAKLKCETTGVCRPWLLTKSDKYDFENDVPSAKSCSTHFYNSILSKPTP